MDSFKPPKPLELQGNLSENWSKFYQSFEIYMVASNFTTASDARKIAILLNTIGEDALEIFNNFKTEDDLKKYTVVIEQFKSYCNPKKNLRYNRFIFYNRNQEDHEQFDHYLTEIQKLIKNCEFKADSSDDMLIDRIILGIADKDLQARLLKTDETELTLSKTIEYCRIAEVTKMQVKKVQEDSSHIDEVKTSTSSTQNVNRHFNYNNNFNNKNQLSHKNNNHESNLNRYENNNFRNQNFQPNNNNRNFKSNFNNNARCNNCNFKHPISHSCPARGKICNFCKKLNHFESACKTKNKTLNLITIRDDNDDEAYFINSITQVNVKSNNKNIFSINKASWTERFKIENNLIDFKLDTGADVSIIPLSIFKLINRNNKYTVKPSAINLEAYDGGSLNPIGEVELFCETRKGFSFENFLIVDTKSQPILSLNCCQRLNFVKRVDSIDQKDSKSKKDFVALNLDIFTGIGKFPEKYKIKVKENSIPTSKPPNRIALKLEEKVKEKLIEMEKQNIISRSLEPSSWVSKLVVVEKPNKSVRLCLDPQSLNTSIVQDYFIIPTFNDLNSKLSNKEVFTVLDLKEGFWQIELEEESTDLCTFSTPFGCYKFNRLPYGINISAEVFQKFNTRYFGDIEGVFIYIDDILIAGQTVEDHNRILKQVVDRARQINVKFNLAKFQYCLPQVKYLGHIFSKEGVSPDPDRIRAILAYDLPKSKKDLQRYLGMVNYLRNFIPTLSELTSPMRVLLKNDTEWCWLPVHDNAFETLKKVITDAPVLRNFDPSKEIVIQTDSSKAGIGCCLLQEKQPVCFASKGLTECECRYSQIEKEFLAILFSCQKFHSYIYGRKVNVCTDHQPLVSIMNKDISDIHSTRLQRIKLKLMKYNLNVSYLPGKEMHIADALSRAFNNYHSKIDTDSSLNEVVHSVNMSDSRILEFQTETEKDAVLKELITKVQDGWPNSKQKVPDSLSFYWNKKNDIWFENGLLFYNHRIIVPMSLRHKMVTQLHQAHFGITKTVARAKSILYWPNMFQSIESEILRCRICERYRSSNTKEMLIPHEIPDLPFQKIGADILDFGGGSYLAIIDYFSKYIEVIKLRTKQSSELIFHFKHVFATHGIPATLIADNVPFASYEFKQFSQIWNFEITTTSPFYARSNGLAEKAVDIAKKLLKKSQDSNTELELSLLEYRNTPVCGMKYSPTEILYSRRTRTLLPISSELLKPKILGDVKENLTKINGRTKFFHDKTAKSRNVSFQPGDNVVFQKNKRWEHGTIINRHKTPRSYNLRGENNRTVRRNTIHLRRSFNRPNFDEYGTHGSFNSRNDRSETNNENIENGSDCTNHQNRLPMIVTRSGRVSRPPVRFTNQ